ncbi:uncharacterized protein LOC124261366 [Haliotis rubra]|uniref:uncharacterized protein LOC124261366 n=1 Tax=Haliotis rubra TaxID=36100 RepID=UPI001EE4F4C5|nr:uncharacterized protein LOC124261366 [Haliotis rubra]XP_046551622.1 uncharacterized protein LOC124261366 [Haliotis rubra]XP_046551624.1 uncharacterized protein LOC124261366 [Haliotis rubra]
MVCLPQLRRCGFTKRRGRRVPGLIAGLVAVVVIAHIFINGYGLDIANGIELLPGWPIHDVGVNAKALSQDRHQTLDLTYNSTFKGRRGYLMKQYHAILDKALGDVQEVYKEIDETIYKKRLQHAKKACDTIPGSDKGVRSTIPTLWYMKQTNMLYCSVAKAGSSFWRRTWNAVTKQRGETIRSPYEYAYEDFNAGPYVLRHLHKFIDSDAALGNLVNSSLKFMYTRDPYSRIFSAYVDKILAPNTYLWGLGRKTISQFRNGSSEKSRSCGHDVTFGEFVKSIISTPITSLDAHFIPVTEWCDVCSLQYDVIGKMETFKTDSMYLMHKAGILGKRVEIKDFGIEYTADSFVDYVTRTFLHRGGFGKCLPFHTAIRRLWRQMQIAGSISKEEQYPLTPAESDTVTEVQLINVMLGAFKRTSSRSRSNKKEAFLQAYRQVPLHDLEQIRAKYSKDFLLFDYDDRPKELFDKTVQPHIKFDYFDVMKE